MKTRFVFLSLIIFIGISWLTFLFINKSNVETERNDDVEQADEKISILMIEPDYYLSLVSKNKYVHEVCNLIFEGLTKKNNELEAELRLAKLIVTDDNLNWEITLRDDVYFHNGDKFTANDVLFTIDKIKELGEQSYYMYNIQNIKKVEIINEYKIKIELNDYDNFLPEKMDFPILCKKYYQKSDFTSENRYVGTGPYKVISKNEELISLKYNENYYLTSNGNIKDIDVKIVAKTRPGFDLLKLGEIDIADTNTEVGAYGRSAYSNSKYVTGVFEGITFNPQNETLKDKTLRQAMILAINRDYIIDKELNGYGIYSDIPVNPNSYLYSEKIKKYAFNPERAQDLLTNSGWIEKNSIRSKDGENLEFDLLINSNSKGATNKAEYIKSDLAKAGIKINIISKSTDDYNDLLKTYGYDMALTDWAVTDYPEFLYNFETNSPNNVFGFSDEDYDYLVYLAKHEILEGKQQEHFENMQDILFDKLPLMGLYFETSTVFYVKNLEGQLAPKINDIYYGINDAVFLKNEQWDYVFWKKFTKRIEKSKHMYAVIAKLHTHL